MLKKILVCLLLLAGPVSADIGEFRYACQVLTVANNEGYVSVRAESMAEARTMAGRANNAVTRDETREAVGRVLECIQLPGGRFSSPGFRRWVDSELAR